MSEAALRQRIHHLETALEHLIEGIRGGSTADKPGGFETSLSAGTNRAAVHLEQSRKIGADDAALREPDVKLDDVGPR